MKILKTLRNGSQIFFLQPMNSLSFSLCLSSAQNRFTLCVKCYSFLVPFGALCDKLSGMFFFFSFIAINLFCHSRLVCIRFEILIQIINNAFIWTVVFMKKKKCCHQHYLAYLFMIITWWFLVAFFLFSAFYLLLLSRTIHMICEMISIDEITLCFIFEYLDTI